MRRAIRKPVLIAKLQAALRKLSPPSEMLPLATELEDAKDLIEQVAEEIRESE